MRFLFVSLFIIFFGLAYAQEPVKQWTLQECVNLALENNLRVRRSLYNVQSSNIGLTQAKMAFLPTLNAGGSYGLNFGRALNPVTNAFINRDNNTLNGQVNASLALFNGLRIQNTFRQNQRDLEASNEDLTKAKNDVIINVVTLYTNVIFNRELYDNATYQLRSSEQQLQRIKRQVEAGSLPKANELNQEALVATNEVNQVNQENSLALSLLQLKQALQLPAATPLDVVIPELEAEDMVLQQSSEEIYQIAQNTMPEVRAAVLRMESAAFALKANKGNLFPRVAINGSAASNYSSASDVQRRSPDGGFTLQQIGVVQSTNEPVVTAIPTTAVIAEGYGRQDQLKDNLFKTANLSLTIPLFNGFQARSSVQRAAINNELARLSLTETENTLRQTIESAYNDAVAASKTYTSSLKQVKAQEEAYRINKQRYESGAINFVEYQVSENDLFRAKSDLTRAKYNFIFRKKILDFYQGNPITY